MSKISDLIFGNKFLSKFSFVKYINIGMKYLL